MINGTGMVNGSGMTNGTLAPSRQGRAPRRGSAILVRWKFLAVLVALVIIIPTFVYLSYYHESDPYQVDGDFGEWTGLPSYSMSVVDDEPLTAIEGWSVAVDGTEVFLYVSAQGDIFPSATVESIFLFIDSDGDPSSGYVAGSLGADHMIEFDGWNGTVQSSSGEV